MAPRPASSGFLEVQQRVYGLLRPDHVVFGAGLRDRDEFPEQRLCRGLAQPVRRRRLTGVLLCPARAARSAACSRRSAASPSASATRTHNAAISASCSASYFRSRAFAVRNQGASPGGPSVLTTCAVHYSRPLSDQRDTPGWLRRTTRAHPDATAIQLRSGFFAETRMAGDRRRSRNPTGPP
jgi:hypothetical protein